MQRREYFLRDHIFFCVTETFCLFLDLKRDQYLSVDSHDFQLLGPHLYGWPIAEEIAARTPLSPSSSASRLASDLLAVGILSEDRKDFKEARPTDWTLPTKTLVNRTEHVPAIFCLSRAATFFTTIPKTARHASSRSSAAS